MAGIKGFLEFIWNSKEKEFLGRDGASWGKICFFYFIFYAILGGFFIGMLAIFNLTLDTTHPRYYDRTSTMYIAKDYESGKKSVNPAIGFRPQTDPEGSLIMYSQSKLSEPDSKTDFISLNRSLELFIQKYYGAEDSSFEIENCETSPLEEVRENLRQNKHCPFHYEHLLQKMNETGTLSAEDPFGYNSVGPTVVLKLNKIYNWLPKPYDAEEKKELPEFLKKYDTEEIKPILENNIIIKCDGEYAADVDSFNRYTPKYYSISKDAEKYSNDFGVLPFYYYPYLNQKNYEAPLIFLQFNVGKETDILTNVLCKAYAANIDSNDKLNKRGMTQFMLYVKK